MKHNQEFFYVSENGQIVDGVITITDLLRSGMGSAGAIGTAQEIMTKNPVTVSIDDDCTVAATAIREYRLKSLPVVERKDSRALAGCIRVRRLMAYVLKEIPHREMPANVRSEEQVKRES